jgi:hypothetical protein
VPDDGRRADCRYDGRRTGLVTYPRVARESERGSAQIGVAVVETVILLQVIVGDTRIVIRVLWVGV